MFKTKPERKQMLRFPEDRHPKISVNSFLEKPSKTSTNLEVEIPITKPPITEPPKQNFPDLSVPTLNSTLCVKKTIENLKKTKSTKIKTTADLGIVDKATYDEKITKQLNYPFDKKLYKKLISLQLSVNTPVQYSASHDHEIVCKDIVPKLEDFYVPQEGPEYCIPMKNNMGTQTSSKQYDGLRLHKVMKTWKDNRPD